MCVTSPVRPEIKREPGEEDGTELRPAPSCLEDCDTGGPEGNTRVPRGITEGEEEERAAEEDRRVSPGGRKEGRGVSEGLRGQ